MTRLGTPRHDRLLSAARSGPHQERCPPPDPARRKPLPIRPFCQVPYLMPALSGDTPEHRVVVVVHRVLAERSVHRTVAADDDLREAGLTSLDMISLVLMLEAEFGFLI